MTEDKKPWLHVSDGGKASVLSLSPQTFPGVVQDGVLQHVLLMFELIYYSCDQFMPNFDWNTNQKAAWEQDKQYLPFFFCFAYFK